MDGFIKRRSMVICAAACLLLTGCGDNLTKLTTEEESLIVTYASGAVAKANKIQAQGMTYLMPEIIEDAALEENRKNDSESGSDTDAGENTGESPESKQKAGGDSSTQPAGDKVQEKSATLTQALNMNGIEAIYKSYFISDTYEQGDYFALEDALEGNTYLFLEITLTNKTAGQVECNIFAANPVCQIVINGETKSAARNTMLVNDFSTYMEPIEGGESNETILIFEVKKEDAENIRSLALKFSMGGNDYNIALE